MKERGHSVYLMSFALKKEKNSIPGLARYLNDAEFFFAKRDYCKFRYLLRKSLLYEIFSYDRQFSRTLDVFARKNKIDVAVFEGLGVAQYRKVIADIPSVLSIQNVEHEIIEHLVSALKKSPSRILTGPLDNILKNFYMYLFGKKEKELVRTCELASFLDFDLIMTCSDRDAAELAKGCGEVALVTIPWCIERPPAFSSPVRKDAYTLLFVGSMQWVPNRDAVEWFVREIFPLLKEQGKNSNS